MKEQVRKSINKAIYEFLSEQQMTKSQLAELIGFTTASLRNKMNGTRDWTWTEILKLSEITGKTLDALAGFAA